MLRGVEDPVALLPRRYLAEGLQPHVRGALASQLQVDRADQVDRELAALLASQLRKAHEHAARACRSRKEVNRRKHRHRVRRRRLAGAPRVESCSLRNPHVSLWVLTANVIRLRGQVRPQAHTLLAVTWLSMYASRPTTPVCGIHCHIPRHRPKYSPLRDYIHLQPLRRARRARPLRRRRARRACPTRQRPVGVEDN